MRFRELRILGALLLVAGLAGAAGAAGQPPADANSEELAAADPGLEPAEEPAEPAADSGLEVAAEPAPAVERRPAEVAAKRATALGPIGYDSQGRQGRIHFVVPGDTLWDISAAYLDTPWVWPSIWSDNREIENPHRIYPGDRIWITDGEMRRLSAEEAEAMLARKPADLAEPPPPAAPAPAPEPPPLAVPDALPTYRVSSREAVGLVSPEELEAAASVIDSPSEQVLLSEGRRVYIGLGQGEVSVGDQFTVFRNEEKVFDPDTGRLLGYHVDMLGWAEVEEVHAEASVARVRVSHSEIERGDRVMPREPLVLDVRVRASPEGVEGRISFFTQSRTFTHQVDYVYLNRGTLDGLEVGSPLEVFRPSFEAREPARSKKVEIPDLHLASLLVVRAEPETAVALVTHSERELEIGDHFRGVRTGR